MLGSSSLRRASLVLSAAALPLIACSSPVDVSFGAGGEGGEWIWDPTTSVTSGSGAGGAVDPVGSGGGTPSSSSATSSSSAASSSSSTSSTTSSSSSSGSGGGGPVGCGTAELCGGTSRGRDDDCDGVVDEGCACVPGQAQGCFKGDPAKVNSPGCFEGTQVCTASGTWGPCEGGVHDTSAPADMACRDGLVAGCHGITALPFVPTSLRDGIGDFGAGATGETWMVSCPEGTAVCPKPTSVGGFSPLVSGEYQVTYSRVASGATAICQFPLIVGDRGLRVELEWERGEAISADVDLHLHRPGTTSPWSLNDGGPEDCGWKNCGQMASVPMPTWFGTGTPPSPTDWYLDPTYERNTCYFHPRDGDFWRSKGLGCHNPRIDSATVNCERGFTDPANSAFCYAENINMDFVPLTAWTRIGVYYYSSGGYPTDIHPVVKVYCDGELSARLGSDGYNQPVSFSPADGGTFGNNRFWSVADVRFSAAEADGRRRCLVQPNYADAAARTPYFMNEALTKTSFGPAYPAIP